MSVINRSLMLIRSGVSKQENHFFKYLKLGGPC